jgi:predicted DNA-binding ribbon-helix-helix protein
MKSAVTKRSTQDTKQALAFENAFWNALKTIAAERNLEVS